MMKSLQEARKDIERELEIRSARIEGTVTRLKDGVSLPGASAGRFVRKHPYESLFGVVAIGAAAAFLVFNRSRKDESDPSRNGVGLADAYADLIAVSMKEAERKGLHGDKALQAAVRANPPVVIRPESHEHSKPLGPLADRLVSTVTALAFEYASSWLSGFLNHRDRRS